MNNRLAVNQLINFSWTILCFFPVLLFWIQHGADRYLYISLGIALFCTVLPQKLLDKCVLSRKPRFYERLGIKQVKKLVQNGDAVNRLLRNQKDYLINDVAQARQYLKTIHMYERFHWVCLVFFLATTVLCFISKLFLTGVFITAANIFYNFYPILLQQYNKIRIRKVLS